MPNKIMGYLRNIDKEDPALEIRRRILNVVLISISSLSIFTIIATIFGPPDPVNQPFLITISVFLIVTILVYLINRYISVFLAGFIFIFILTISILIIDSPQELIQGRSLFFTSIPIVAAGILLRPIGSFAVAVFTAIFMYVLAIQNSITYNTFGLAGFIALALFSWLSSSRLEKTLSDLQSINKQLDERVSERTQDLQTAITQLAEANRRLTELDRLKSKFVTDISHELRTPVSNLTIYLDMLQPEHANDINRRYLKILQEETTRLTNLIGDILDLSKIETVGRTLEKRKFKITDIIDELVNANKYKAAEKGIKIITEIDNNLNTIEGDPKQIFQALGNIVVNAINYSERGTIKIKVIQQGNNAEISICDMGIGISDEDLDHLFERFYRGSNASQSTIPGTGLGLSIAKEIVDLHKGKIIVKKNEGKGTTFAVILPISFN